MVFVVVARVFKAVKVVAGACKHLVLYWEVVAGLLFGGFTMVADLIGGFIVIAFLS